MEKTHRIPPATTAGLIVLVVITGGLLYLAGWMVTHRADNSIGAVIGLFVTVPVAFTFVWFLLQQGQSTLVLDGEKLRLNVPWYGREISLGDVQIDEARILEDGAEEWSLRWRTNGIGLPGYQVGWFKTKGGHRVLAARTQGALVLIPTAKGYSLLVSLSDPQAFLQALSEQRVMEETR